MSNDWKLVQGLKRKTQNDSFKTGEYRENEDAFQRRIKENKYKAIINFWKKGDNIFYNPENEEELMKSLELYIEYCKTNNEDISGIYNGMNFIITEEEPIEVKFGNLNNGNHDNKVNIIINDEKMITDFRFFVGEHWVDVKEKGLYRITDIRLKKYINGLYDGRRIEEYSFSSTNDRKLDEKIRDYLLSLNPEFETAIKERTIQKETTSDIIEFDMNCSGLVSDNIELYDYNRDKNIVRNVSVEYEQNKSQQLFSILKKVFEKVKEQKPELFNSKKEDEKELNLNVNNIEQTLTCKIMGLDFSISEKNSNEIVFKSLQDGSTVKIVDGKITYSEMHFTKQKTTHYWSKKNKLKVPLLLSREISVFNGTEINEHYKISPHKVSEKTDLDSDLKKRIIDEVVIDNPEYSVGNEGEFYRSEIEPGENVKRMFLFSDVLEKYLIPGSRNKLGSYPSGFYGEYGDSEDIGESKTLYGEYADEAKEFEQECLKRYFEIIKRREKLERKEVVIVEEEGRKQELDIIQVSETEEDIEQKDNKLIHNNTESSVLEKQSINVDHLSDEELEQFIDKMNTEQKEKAQRIERLKKIRRAKELIALSIAQDNEISELESQIKMKGRDINE